MISRCLVLGVNSIKEHLTLTEQIVDNKINNFDPLLTSKMLDCFEEDIKQLKEYIIIDSKNETPKLETSLIQDNLDNPVRKTMYNVYMKMIEHVNKGSV